MMGSLKVTGTCVTLVNDNKMRSDQANIKAGVYTKIVSDHPNNNFINGHNNNNNNKNIRDPVKSIVYNLGKYHSLLGSLCLVYDF